MRSLSDTDEHAKDIRSIVSLQILDNEFFLSFSSSCQERRSAIFSSMLYAAQIRAARVLLGWRQQDLAKAEKSVGQFGESSRDEESPKPMLRRLFAFSGAGERRSLRFINKADEIGVALQTNNYNRLHDSELTG